MHGKLMCDLKMESVKRMILRYYGKIENKKFKER